LFVSLPVAETELETMMMSDICCDGCDLVCNCPDKSGDGRYWTGDGRYWTGGECDEITMLFPPFALNSAAASTVEKLVAKATAELLEEVSVRQTSWSLEMKITRKNETSSRHSGQR
jgi:hypothetical protein